VGRLDDRAEARLQGLGPFRRAVDHMDLANAAFDQSLRQRAPQMGIRDFSDVGRLAQSAGFVLLDDVAMPANNRCLVWQRTSR